MRQTLRSWVADADTRQNIEQYGLKDQLPTFEYQDGRAFDLYIALIGELFDLLRDQPDDSRDWATLGNALAQAANGLEGSSRSDALFFSASAFYNGGYSASAYLTMRLTRPDNWDSEIYRACFDFLARPTRTTSQPIATLIEALLNGTTQAITQVIEDAAQNLVTILDQDPAEWVAQRVYVSLLNRFAHTNIRSVLPNGQSSTWDPLIGSLLNRPQPVWDFFPSQISAIEAGLLTSDMPFSLQMPTGAGKTALTETLIFNHLTARPDDLAVLLVPYRALARELRNSFARRLSRIGLPTRTVYGGTVPSREEAQGLDTIRTIIATPEALTGLLGRAPELLPRISLVVCDEGHLLDAPGRGVGLELLLARLLGRESGPPRTVFVSAIVPNIEEINAWVGGSDETVVRSRFRPAVAEYAVLQPSGRGRNTQIDMRMHPVDTTLQAHVLAGFLKDSDFRYINAQTGRRKTYQFSTIKTQTIATACKSLSLGTVAVFSATKTGNQGVVGLAEELLEQIDLNLPMPKPLDHIRDAARVALVCDYLSREFGAQWVGTRALLAGAVVHHGDIPQETREAVEELLTEEQVRLVLCTGTLAEGVNLPIRTLILYAVKRRTRTGQAIPMLARDIRNLVGRAGRAGSSTKGLVICANPNQWEAVYPVASEQPGEDVHGALRALVERLQEAIGRGVELSNDLLEQIVDLQPLTDGIDATLLELLHEELGDSHFHEVASTLAEHTFASRQLDAQARGLLDEVFTMRATRLLGLRSTGRLAWVRDTGAKTRLVDSVVNELAPRLDNWGAIESPLDNGLLDALLSWAYQQPDFQRDLQNAFPASELLPPQDLPDAARVREIVGRWLAGDSFADIADWTNRPVDEVLRIHGSVISYSFATLVEQAIALLQMYLAGVGIVPVDAVTSLPEYLRFGVSTPAARAMMSGGVRHRRAAVALSGHSAMTAAENALLHPREIARIVLSTEFQWQEILGKFVYERTLQDVADS